MKIFRVTLRVIKQVTIMAGSAEAAEESAMHYEEHENNVIGVDVEDQYEIDSEGNIIQ